MKKILNIVSWLFVLMVALPLLCACFYTVPVTDDFYGALNVSASDANRLVTAVRLMTSCYCSAQGTYTGAFSITF